MYLGILFLHILAATIWTGGHIVLATTVLPRALKAADPRILLVPGVAHGILFHATPFVRDCIVDKDRTPHWDPPTLAGVTPEMVDAYFVG